MAWFKVDDALWSHPKFAVLSDAAQALWLRAGAWSAQHLTDGHIPAHIAPMIRLREDIADELVQAGLWDSEESGWAFHDWSEYQPTRESVESEREAARERMRKRRRNKGGQFASSSEDVRANTPRTFEGTSEEVRPPGVRPPRPDPARPELSDESSADDAPASKSRKKPATTIPDGWQPTDSHRQKAQQQGVSLEREAEQFRLHAEANDRRCVNWNSAFAMWLNKARPDARPADNARPRTAWDYGPEAYIHPEEIEYERRASAAASRDSNLPF